MKYRTQERVKTASAIVAVVLFFGLIATAVVGEYANIIPCSWYSHVATKDIPGRCTTLYHK